MARPLRIELPGGLYHITSRGDRREDIYLNDADRLEWLRILKMVCHRFNWVCHAWCQMTNHYHIIIETPEGNLSQGMRQLNGVYTQWINRAHDRVGHVFQGRYKAIIIDKDSYLLEVARYVVLNPVRAGMVRDTKQWAWSSYRNMIGQVAAPEWLETDWILGQFSKQRARAITKYIEFVHDGIELPSPWLMLKGQIYLGDEKFMARMQQHAENEIGQAEIPRAQRRPITKPLTYYQKKYKTRNDAIYQTYLSGDYSMKHIATHFGLHYCTVSRVIRKMEPDA
ncbi:MAG: transposase [Gammaproteobacteria bacterium]|nr:transposase [Gammaproteobacteria bacterium]